MHKFAHLLYLFFAHLGGMGLLLLGVLDSSFLFMPLGNDLLLIGLAVQHHDRVFYYVPMAAIGSVLGCLLLDVVVRKGGEEGLKKRLPPKRLEYLKRKISEHAALALAVTALAPPPFPFTPVIGAASALQYPRWKLLSVILAARLVRFSIIAYLALRFGRHLLALAKRPSFEWGVGIFIAICVIGSSISIYRWVHRSSGR